MTSVRLAIGTMTGTSIDGLDIALVRAIGTGTSMRVELERSASFSLGPLALGLRNLAEGRSATASEIARLALAFGQLHADAIIELASDELPGGAKKGAERSRRVCREKNYYSIHGCKR